MKEMVTLALSLINWKPCFITALMLCVPCMISAALEARFNGVTPKFTRIIVIISSWLAGVFALITAVDEEDILYVGNAVYIILAIIIVIFVVALRVAYNKIAEVSWNIQEEVINRK